MALSRDAFIEKYLDELEGNIGSIKNAVKGLKNDPESQDDLRNLLRSIHSIKGSSKMLKFDCIEAIVHGLEGVFRGVAEGRYDVSPRMIQLGFLTVDYLQNGKEKIRIQKSDELPVADLFEVFERARANEPFSLDHLRPEAAEPVEPKSFETDIPPEFRLSVSDKIQVRLSRMETIIRKFNNLMIRQFRMKKEYDEIRDLESHFKEMLGKFSGDNGQIPMGHDFLDRIRQLRKGFDADLRMLERSAQEIREEIYSLRMLPLDLVLQPVKEMVADMAESLGKEIELTVSGGDIRLDKLVLEKIHDPIIHLVRNGVDHGLEKPLQRTARGKPRAGQLTIACSRETEQVVIRIADDGRGIDYEKIREKSMAMHPMQAEEIRVMDRDALNAFIFSSGFSTLSRVGELSGRGVGLDLVRYNIEKVKGKITLSNPPEGGSEFLLTLPHSIATVEGFFIGAGKSDLFVPANFISEIMLIHPKDIFTMLNRRSIRRREKVVPIYRLSGILERTLTDAEIEKGPEEYRSLMIIDSLGETVAVEVDRVVEYASLVHKPLPENLSDLKLVQGIVFDKNFRIIPILHIPEILTRLKRMREMESKKRFSMESREYKKILLVEDSDSAREIVRSVLALENYNVVTAADGIEGLERLREHRIHLIITDIKMPRMDGLTFVENIRRESGYESTPLIVITSVDDPEIRAQFYQKGANAYILKSEFDRGNLIQEVRTLIG